jgi:hypothetical protein
VYSAAAEGGLDDVAVSSFSDGGVDTDDASLDDLAGPLQGSIGVDECKVMFSAFSGDHRANLGIFDVSDHVGAPSFQQDAVTIESYLGHSIKEAVPNFVVSTPGEELARRGDADLDPGMCVLRSPVDCKASTPPMLAQIGRDVDGTVLDASTTPVRLGQDEGCEARPDPVDLIHITPPAPSSTASRSVQSLPSMLVEPLSPGSCKVPPSAAALRPDDAPQDVERSDTNVSRSIIAPGGPGGLAVWLFDLNSPSRSNVADTMSDASGTDAGMRSRSDVLALEGALISDPDDPCNVEVKLANGWLVPDVAHVLPSGPLPGRVKDLRTSGVFKPRFCRGSRRFQDNILEGSFGVKDLRISGAFKPRFYRGTRQFQDNILGGSFGVSWRAPVWEVHRKLAYLC